MAEKAEDLSLPQAVVNRIINDAIPPNAIMSAEARKVICKTASVFILYSTATAGATAVKKGRKAMNADDVIEALGEMEFQQFVDPLKKSLDYYRSLQKQRKESAAAKKSEESTKGNNNKSATITTPSTSKGTPKTGTSKKSSPTSIEKATEVITLSDTD